jgi:general stress protein YciG
MTPPKDASPEMKNRIEAEKENLRKFEADFEARREQARKGGSTTSTAAPTAPGGSLVPGKDGSFDYVSKP